MDKALLLERLLEGSRAVGAELTEGQATSLLRLGDELLKWNAKVNLTAITDPLEIVEKHFIDSLACVPVLRDAKRLLDLGAGAGFPGLPLKVACPSLQVTLVDAVAKKVTFIKHAAVTLKLTGVRALHVRAQGSPEAEGVPRADLLVSRALMDVPEWLALAKHYVLPGGRIVAMTGQAPDRLEAAVNAAGLRLQDLRRYQLPFSKAERHLIVCTA